MSTYTNLCGFIPIKCSSYYFARPKKCPDLCFYSPNSVLTNLHNNALSRDLGFLIVVTERNGLTKTPTMNMILMHLQRACLITLHSNFEIFQKGHPAVEFMIDRRIFER